MNKRLPRHLALFLGSIILTLSFAEAAPMNCHLHAPDDFHPFGNKLLVIPSAGDPMDCENLNQQRFTGRGLCHCSFDSNGIGSRKLPGIPAYNGRNPMPLP